MNYSQDELAFLEIIQEAYLNSHVESGLVKSLQGEDEILNNTQIHDMYGCVPMDLSE